MGEAAQKHGDVIKCNEIIELKVRHETLEKEISEMKTDLKELSTKLDDIKTHMSQLYWVERFLWVIISGIGSYLVYHFKGGK